MSKRAAKAADAEEVAHFTRTDWAGLAQIQCALCAWNELVQRDGERLADAHWALEHQPPPDDQDVYEALAGDHRLVDIPDKPIAARLTNDDAASADRWKNPPAGVTEEQDDA